jgi:hypothetical protein
VLNFNKESNSQIIERHLVQGWSLSNSGEWNFVCQKCSQGAGGKVGQTIKYFMHLFCAIFPIFRYECAANSSSEGRELRDDVYLRLDFSFWYAPEPFSMFFGSCLAALVFCAASFVLNIVWIFVRWVVLRCIKRAGLVALKTCRTQPSLSKTQSSSTLSIKSPKTPLPSALLNNNN